MIAILTDKPSVGKEIGRIIGATRVRNGYVEGNGYMVTWTFGNMLSLAMPKDYGTQKLERNDFPFIPSEFELMVRHTRTENGWIPDIDAVLQLKVTKHNVHLPERRHCRTSPERTSGTLPANDTGSRLLQVDLERRTHLPRRIERPGTDRKRKQSDTDDLVSRR